MMMINAEHISARSFSIQLLYSDQNLSAQLILFLLLNETLNIYICTLNTLYNVYMHYTIKTHLPVLHICHSLWLRKIKTFQVCQNSQISGNSTTVTIWIFNRGCNVRWKMFHRQQKQIFTEVTNSPVSWLKIIVEAQVLFLGERLREKRRLRMVASKYYIQLFCRLDFDILLFFCHNFFLHFKIL